ncbi:hypothetical protein AALM99_11825 [Lactococcus muris]|uniref:Phage protein n=1 Tax=Lactococcus muris TaxID=2941330 RepID=A0ABV4DDS3_9LACT
MKLKEFLETHNTEDSKHWNIEISAENYNFKWHGDYSYEALNPELLDTVINNWGIEPQKQLIFVVL